MKEYKKEKQIEVEVCVQIMRAAFSNLRATEQYYQVNHNEVAFSDWEKLMNRIKIGAFYRGPFDILCAVPANIAQYVQDIEKIRLKVFEEGYRRTHQ